jgi:hypothetical protein
VTVNDKIFPADGASLKRDLPDPEFHSINSKGRTMGTVTTKDSMQVYCKDWVRDSPSFSAMDGS